MQKPSNIATVDAPSDAEPVPGRSATGLLAAFSLALALPIVLFAAFLFWRVATNERARVEGDAIETARSIALSIDREISGLEASLDALSLSSFLDKGDFDGFYGQAEQLAQRQGIIPVLSDMSGRQLVNLRLPRGAELPQSNLPLDAEAVASGKPFVTDLFAGRVAGRYVFSVAIGVQRGGQTRYVLSFSLDPERLRRIIEEADVPPAWTVSIVDRGGLIMARSVRQDEFVGRAATRDLQDSTRAREGTWSGHTLDGRDIFGAYTRSRLSGYRAAVGVSTADLNAPLWQSLSLFAALGLVIACLSVLLAFLFGQRITVPMKALAGRAAALGRGAPVLPLATGLLEANQVGGALVAAASSRLERERDLREANDEIQRFAYIVSHDLRSPLVNIMGFTTELEALRSDVFDRLRGLREHAVGHDPGPASPQAAASAASTDKAFGKDDELGRDFDEAIGFIKASIAKMDRLINAILKLSREGRRDFRPERVDMDGLVRSIADSLAHQAAEAGAEIEAAKLPAALSDRLALEQIFSNLIDNALKYLRRGVPGRIEIAGRATADGLVYDVRDNGRGIDPKDHERVFDLFRRSGVQDRPGEGIGLAHVRTLVRRLGGVIAFTSEVGHGTTFTVTLPRRWAGERQTGST